MDGGDICFFPPGREGGSVVYMVEELCEEWQACGARTLEHFVGEEIKAGGLAIFYFVEVGLDFRRGEGSLYGELRKLRGRGVGGKMFST